MGGTLAGQLGGTLTRDTELGRETGRKLRAAGHMLVTCGWNRIETCGRWDKAINVSVLRKEPFVTVAYMFVVSFFVVCPGVLISRNASNTVASWG